MKIREFTAHDFPAIVEIHNTSTSVANRPMLRLYERLGFVPQPDWIQLEKVCRVE